MNEDDRPISTATQAQAAQKEADPSPRFRHRSADFQMIGPRTAMQMLADLHRLPRKGSRAHRRRHRAFILWRWLTDGGDASAIYRAARRVMPLP